MTLAIRASIVIPLTLALSACATGPSELTDEQASAVRDGVGAMLAEYRSAFAERDWAELMGYYADEPAFRWIERGVVTYRSPADIRQSVESLPTGMTIETTYTDMEITPVAQDAATLVAGFESKFADTTGGGFSFSGMLTATLVSREGRWQFLNGHTSPPPPSAYAE